MLAKILSGATVGLDPVPIQVEVDVAQRGLPSFTIVGLPDKAVEEARERVRTAIINSGATFPSARITVNLAPADLPKSGPAFDLPIALGILIASGQLSPPRSNHDLSDGKTITHPNHPKSPNFPNDLPLTTNNSLLSDTLVFGELSLDGSLRHTQGVLPIALLAKLKKFHQLFIPTDNAPEASVVSDVQVYPFTNLQQLFNHLSDLQVTSPHPHTPFSLISHQPLTTNHQSLFDLADIKGQEAAKRALEIAAAGFHNLFLHGTPGAGKTLLARTLPTILPTLTEPEALEVTKIYSISGNLSPDTPIITTRPFRSPHHTTSRIGLTGGGTRPMPGEISLAHRGVLFLDEFPEFARGHLESLRQPLEDGHISISRAAGTIRFPSRFLMVAAANPCPCGYHGSSQKPCRCLPGQITRYQKRLSGPILDRIDLHIHCPAVPAHQLTNLKPGESSSTVRQRVQQAHSRQLLRFKNHSTSSNGEMTSKQVKQFCLLNKESLQLLETAVHRLHLTARSYFKIIKIARTIADLAGDDNIQTSHLSEALQYRPQDSFH